MQPHVRLEGCRASEEYGADVALDAGRLTRVNTFVNLQRRLHREPLPAFVARKRFLALKGKQLNIVREKSLLGSLDL